MAQFHKIMNGEKSEEPNGLNNKMMWDFRNWSTLNQIPAVCSEIMPSQNKKFLLPLRSVADGISLKESWIVVFLLKFRQSGAYVVLHVASHEWNTSRTRSFK